MSKRISLAEFEKVTTNAEYGTRYELIDGVVHVKPISVAASILAARISAHLSSYALAVNNGCVTSARYGYVLSSFDRFVPEVGFLSEIPLGDLPPGQAPFPPDLAVEIIDTPRDLRATLDRIMTYLQGGASEVWTVYPMRRMIDVHHLAGSNAMITYSYHEDDTYQGQLVLHNFRVKIGDIFRNGAG